MADEAFLSAEGLSAGYGHSVIVDGLNFTVKPGEILTLIGPNGAGKSTVLRTISAQLPSLAGEVYIGGRALSGLSERELSKQLSLLLTDKLTAERMTCEDVVATGRYPYTGRLGILSEDDRRVIAGSMELTAVTPLRDRDFRQISDGQRQCVMLARAIAQQPSVMILDEPTSFLDISHKLKLLTLLRRLVRDRNIAVIQSLHELDLAQKFSDRVLCIHNGHADRLGTPEEVFTGDYISRLYSIEDGCYNTLYSAVEPGRFAGTPEVFVIGGGGMGVPVYRQLYRQGVTFAAGVIHENDLDFPAAKALAARVITARPFEEISESSLNEALMAMSSCKTVICCIERFGTMNFRNELLLREAERCGKLVTEQKDPGT